MTAIHEENQDIIRQKKNPDRIEVLVKEHLANTTAAEDTLRIALALLEKHKAKYTQLQQYAENVSPSDRIIGNRFQM